MDAQFKESETIELKKSISQLEKALKTVCAFLNHKGGDIYFGIDEKAGSIIGQEATDSNFKYISQQIRSRIKPEEVPSITELQISGKPVIKLHIDKGKNGIYYLDGIPYIRCGTESIVMPPEEVRKKIIGQISWEEQVSGKGISSINISALKEFIEKANNAGRINFNFDKADSALNKLNLLKADKLKKAAEVLFCNDNSLEVQAAVFAGVDKLTFIDIKQIKGTIFNVLEQSESYIKEHINWRADLKGREREEIPEIPLRAITESLVNSLSHRDYANPKGNEIAIFKDRVEIYNPGQFPEEFSPEDFIKGKERSILRNPIIANTLYLSKDVERWGSGIKRIYEACTEAKVKVEFKKLKSGFLVVFYRSFTPQATPQKTPQATPQAGLTELERKILDEITKNNKISRKQLSELLGIGTETIKEYLEKLKKKGILERIGKTSSGYWRVIR